MNTGRTMIVAATAMLAGSATAQNLSVVNQPMFSSENNHQEILELAFGGQFTSTGTVEGVNVLADGPTTTDAGFTNDFVTVTRIEDNNMSLLPSLNDISSMGMGDDDRFAAGQYQAAVLDTNSSLDHTFGIFDDDGNFTSVLDSADGGVGTLLPTESFRFGIQVSNGTEFTSDPSDNDGRDHMVSYAVFDANNELLGAIIFFEDLGTDRSDFDYNDLAILLTVAPTPQAALMGLAGIGGIGLAASRRRR